MLSGVDPIGTIPASSGRAPRIQGVSGDPPFHELQAVQSFFREQEGLGGAKTLRGISKNRYTGEGFLLWNAELRWRVVEFRLLRRSFHLVLSIFSDSGRVWAERIEPDEVLSGLHHGYGGGVRLGMGENFIVGLNVGHPVEASTSIHFGAGYPD